MTLYNCGGIPVDLIIPADYIWDDQQWCLDLIAKYGSPEIARAEIWFYRAVQDQSLLYG